MPVADLRNIQWKDPSTKQAWDALLRELTALETRLNAAESRVGNRG